MNIKIYRGKEISSECVRFKLEMIMDTRRSESKHTTADLTESFKYSMLYCPTKYDDNQYLVLGQDWFLLYSVLDGLVTIDFLVSVDNTGRIVNRSIEMYSVFKQLFLKYGNFRFAASLNEYSRPFYNLAVKKGLIKELLFVDDNSEYVDTEFYPIKGTIQKI